MPEYDLHTADVAAALTKNVVCEKCGHRFSYIMARGATGVGLAAAPTWFIDPQNDAAQDAKDAAYRKTYRRLFTESEPVACPQCRWYQADMNREMRRRRWMNATLAAGALAILSVLPAIGTILLSFPDFDARPGRELWLIACAGPAAALLLLAIRWQIRRGIDLNAGYPDHIAPYPGAPEPFETEVPDPGTSPSEVADQAAAALDRENADLEKGWHFSRNGKVDGPVTWDGLRRRARQGGIAPTDLVWHESFGDWVAAGDVDGLFARTEAQQDEAC